MSWNDWVLRHLLPFRRKISRRMLRGKSLRGPAEPHGTTCPTTSGQAVARHSRVSEREASEFGEFRSATTEKEP